MAPHARHGLPYIAQAPFLELLRRAFEAAISVFTFKTTLTETALNGAGNILLPATKHKTPIGELRQDSPNNGQRGLGATVRTGKADGARPSSGRIKVENPPGWRCFRHGNLDVLSYVKSNTSIIDVNMKIYCLR
jgi:hypothetical protein